jgi:transposase
MLYYSANINKAHFYKECFLKILDCENSSVAKKQLSEWITDTERCGLNLLKSAPIRFVTGYGGILNSFDISITIGFTEGCNNKIKVLKRNAYGYKNFKRFRNRILHMFSHQTQKQPAV